MRKTKSSKFKQNGGTWKKSIKRGIRKASDQYINKKKWYHSIPLADVGNYVATKRTSILLSRLADAIAVRCKKMNIFLQEVSSKDFEKLTFNTRLIFLKQDFKQQMTYDVLLKRIENGDLDSDFEKYYASFKYTKHSKHDIDGMFRKSISKSVRNKYHKNIGEKELFEDIDKEYIDTYSSKKHKRNKKKRKKSKRKNKF